MLQRGNLAAAWKRVRANKGAAGIDGMTIDEFPAWEKSGEWSRVTSKSRVVKTSESKFLGFTFQGGRIQWPPKTWLKFKQQIRRLTNRNGGVSMKYQLFKTSQFIRGWINYFGIANGYQRGVELDHWIRRRIRMA